MQALFSAMSVMVAGSTASMLSMSVCLSLRVGDGSGKWFMPFYRGGVRSIDKIASNYTVRAGFGIGFSLRCWRFCQLANCFFVFALVSPAPSSPAPLLPYCHAHACARGNSGWWGRHFSPGCLAEFLLCSGLDSVFLALEHVRAPFAAPYSPTSGRVGTGLVIKYAGYQCQWCQKSTPAA